MGETRPGSIDFRPLFQLLSTLVEKDDAVIRFRVVADGAGEWIVQVTRVKGKKQIRSGALGSAEDEQIVEVRLLL